MPGELLYLDSSALVKLAVAEVETPSLRRAIRNWPIRVSSIVASVEIARAARRSGRRGAYARGREVIDGLELLALDDEIVRLAVTVEPVELRSTDAVHVASALSLASSVGAFACYDRRLREAAERVGLPILAPT